MHETFAVYKEHPVGVVLGLLQHSSYNHIYALHLWVLCVETILFCVLYYYIKSWILNKYLDYSEWNICMISFYLFIFPSRYAQIISSGFYSKSLFGCKLNCLIHSIILLAIYRSVDYPVLHFWQFKNAFFF